MEIVSPERTVGYMGPTFHALQKAGVEIESVLDVGAAQGHFSSYLKFYWPEAKITAIECNKQNNVFLDNTNWNVLYKCLGDKKCSKTFYTNPDEPTGGGSSLYLENTQFFDNPNEETVQLETLDSLKLGKFDLVKIDTQGSELDIIKGGEQTVKNARFLLLELSFMNYNKGAPLIDDILEHTRRLGFRMLDTFGPEGGGHWFNYRKVQVDVLFVKDNDKLLYMV